jgi:hypothetical protein
MRELKPLPRSFCWHAIHVLCRAQTLVLLEVLLQRKEKLVLIFIILLQKCWLQHLMVHLLLPRPTLASLVILFSSYILKGSDHGVEHSESLAFWTPSIFWNSKY